MTGRFLTLEGIDGAGKTTLASVLVPWLEQRGHIVRYVSSVGYEPIDRVTSQLVIDRASYDPYAHLFLSHANSRILCKTVIAPAIHNGEIVILDRYYHSAIAYSMPMGMSLEWMLDVSSVLIEPDAVIYCDVSVDTALRRKESRIQAIEIGFRTCPDVSQAFLAYQSAVKQSYQRLVERDPGRFIVVPCEGRIEDVSEYLFAKLEVFI